MKIGQYCPRQRCKHVGIKAIFGRLSRRAGLSAIGGLSCIKRMLYCIVLYCIGFPFCDTMYRPTVVIYGEKEDDDCDEVTYAGQGEPGEE